MRRISVSTVVVVVALAIGFEVRGVSPWLVILAAGVLAVGAWQLSVCRHAGPLALLPATSGLDGSTLPPRWHCDRCGATWPARFEKTHTPVRRFTGYDQSKAAIAARRAAELSDRRRALAVQRAGLSPGGSRQVGGHAAARSSVAKKAKPAPELALAPEPSADVVSIEHGRRFAG